MTTKNLEGDRHENYGLSPRANQAKCFAARDLDGVLADYGENGVLFGHGDALRRPNAIKTVFAELPNSQNQVFPSPEDSDQSKTTMHTSFGAPKP